MEMRLRQQEAFDRARDVFDAVDAEWGERFGRRWGAVEAYRTEDAELVLVTSGTVTSTARHVVNEARARGERIGLLKVKMFRPFPTALLRRHLAGVPAIAVLDRNISPGHGGIFAEEIRSALYDLPDDRRPRLHGFVIGLGGRDVTPAVIEECIATARGKAAAGVHAGGNGAPAGDLAPGAPRREDLWVGVKP
jgi:pyruvate/2-oxoacid:ferredoxin oxidoreductase alpha subunit